MYSVSLLSFYYFCFPFVLLIKLIFIYYFKEHAEEIILGVVAQNHCDYHIIILAIIRGVFIN